MLHSQPVGLYLGSACGMLTGVVGLLEAGRRALAMTSLTLAMIAFSRSIIAFGISRLRGRLSDLLRTTCWLGAIGNAAAAGVAAGLSLNPSNASELGLLMVSFALIYGARVIPRSIISTNIPSARSRWIAASFPAPISAAAAMQSFAR